MSTELLLLLQLLLAQSVLHVRTQSQVAATPPLRLPPLELQGILTPYVDPTTILSACATYPSTQLACACSTPPLPIYPPLPTHPAGLQVSWLTGTTALICRRCTWLVDSMQLHLQLCL